MAKIGVYWVLDHTIKYAPGGVGEPIKIGVLKRDGKDWKANILDETQEQAQFIADLEERIRPRDSIDQAAASPPPPPQK